MHNLISNLEDQVWDAWRVAHPVVTKADVLAEAKLLDEKYHTNWLYTTPISYTQHSKERPRTTLRLHVAVHGYFRPPPP
jgi:hypothetical protein